jgi:hypothetical protein
MYLSASSAVLSPRLDIDPPVSYSGLGLLDSFRVLAQSG